MTLEEYKMLQEIHYKVWDEISKTEPTNYVNPKHTAKAWDSFPDQTLIYGIKATKHCVGCFLACLMSYNTDTPTICRSCPIEFDQPCTIIDSDYDKYVYFTHMSHRGCPHSYLKCKKYAELIRDAAWRPFDDELEALNIR